MTSCGIFFKPNTWSSCEDVCDPGNVGSGHVAPTLKINQDEKKC